MKNIILNINEYYRKNYNKNLKIIFLSYNFKEIEILVWIKDIDYIVETINISDIKIENISSFIRIKLDIIITNLLYTYISN